MAEQNIDWVRKRVESSSAGFDVENRSYYDDSSAHTGWLKKEIYNWKANGIINDYQVQRILSNYGLANSPSSEAIKPEGEGKSSKLIDSISTVGAALIGIGAIFFVASNWNAIPDFLKLILLFGTTFGTYYMGWKLKFDAKTHPKLGGALLFLASILVGVTIFLTAQIFNVNANSHWLVLLWFFAISPFGYAFNSKNILKLNIFTFALWIVLYTTSASSWGWHSAFEIIMLYLLFGISLYGFGQLHARTEKYAHFRTEYQGVGLFFILISYFYFSFETPYGETFGKIAPTDWTIQMLFALFGITSLISIAINASSSEMFKTARQEFYVLLLAFIGWVGTWSLSFFKSALIASTTATAYGYSYSTLKPGVSTTLLIAYNLILFALSIGSIIIGQYKSTVSFVNLGMLFFVFGIFHLYFATIFELLPTSLAFIGGGVVLLGVGGYLEKKRRSLISNMNVVSQNG